MISNTGTNNNIFYHVFDAGKHEEIINLLNDKLMCLSDGQNHLLEQDQNSYGPNSGHGTLVSLEEQEQIASGPNSKHGTLVPYHKQDQNAHDLTNMHGILVPYQKQDHSAQDPTSKHVTLVPYQGSFDHIKKQRAPAKVNLDPETMKVWKQLMDNKSSEGETKVDEEKDKWWAEERNIFSGRVNAFIAIMNHIQGTFSLFGIFLNELDT